METVTFYTFTKKANSLKQPITGGNNIEFLYKKETSIFSPILILNTFNNSWNYAKIGNLYYTVTNITLLNATQREIQLEIDPLATWKSDILATTAFVSLSSSTFDVYLTDTRNSTDQTPITTTSSSLLFEDVVNFDEDFQCIAFSYATANGVGTVWLTQGEMILVLLKLGSTGYNDFLVQFEKQFSGAYQALIGAKRLPFKFYNRGATARITLGTYDTEIDGKFMIEPVAKYETNVSIPWQFEDFRNLHPYTTLQLFLPSFGYLELNPSDFIGQGSINVKASVDFYTGHCTYMVGNVAKCEGVFGTDMPLGFVSGNATALVSAGIGLAGATAAGVVSGGVGFIAGGIGVIDSIISSQQRTVGTTGGSPSMSAMYATDTGELGHIKCVVIAHNTATPPESFSESNGRLLNKVVTLSELSGYCKTANFSVQCSAPKIFTEIINTTLDGGIYIE